ncbi:MAG: hypothetical protein ABII79_03790 [bacterium]
MENMLREDEIFVVKTLCAVLSGTYRAGENPPDAYLSYEGKEVAVEISTLTQHVISDSGDAIPRLSQDTGVIRLCDELDGELGKDVPNGVYVILTLHSPINKIRKFKELLKQQVISIIKSSVALDKIIDIKGNIVKVRSVHGERPDGKKIIGIVINKNTSSNISDNVVYILGQRIEEKTIKCMNVNHRPLWLALFNNYWLAESRLYQEALKTLSIEHPFEKIFLVDDGKHVHEINQT